MRSRPWPISKSSKVIRQQPKGREAVIRKVSRLRSGQGMPKSRSSICNPSRAEPTRAFLKKRPRMTQVRDRWTKSGTR